MLLGFIPIRPTWKAVSFKRLETATEKVMALVDAKPEYPDEQVVIYDIGDVKPETEKKRRGRRKKSEIEAEQKEN